MRVAVFALALMAGPVLAQDKLPTMTEAVVQAKLRVCAVDKESRQCAILRELVIDTVQGRYPVVGPELTPAERAEIRNALRRTN
jgi:uncharacterized circularly permuted ATP-grasp superfamily protein